MSERSDLPAEALRYVFDRLPDLVLILDPTAIYITDVNADGANGLGWTPDQMIGEKLHRFCIPDDQAPPGLRQRASEGEVVSFDRLMLRNDGMFVNYNFVGLQLDDLDRQGLLIGRPMERLLASDSKLSDLLKLADLASDGFVVSDTNGRVKYCNRAAAELGGIENPLGMDVRNFFVPDEEYHDEMVAVLRSGQGEIRATVTRVDGTEVPVAIRASFDKETNLWYSVERDISDTVARENELRQLNETLQIQASTDWLTRVANRKLLEHELENAEMSGQPFAVLILDIDDFKSVNDTLGHEAGDEMLRAIAGRLQNTVSSDDLLARLGGDEFVVLLRGTSLEQASVVAQRLIDVLRERYRILGRTISRSCSVGIAVYNTTTESESILRRADMALYQAKAAGRNQFAIYDHRMAQAIDNRIVDRRTNDV